MTQSTIRQTSIAAVGILLGIAALATPGPADAVQKLPGSCELVQATACGAPGSLLDQILALFRVA